MPTPLLTGPELAALVAELPAWSLHDGKLTREYIFHDFPAAMAFVNHVAALAERANHHPDIDIRYNRVTLALVSHDSGGITGRDARMAHRLETEMPTQRAPA